MKKWTIPALALVAGLCAPLRAQEARFGVALNLAIPTGALSGTTYPPDAYVTAPTRESYDAGIGAQFTVSFPRDRSLALRLNLGGQSFSGRSTAPGYARVNLQQQMVSLGADLQLFLADGNAFRQSGTYVLAGVAADFERFDSSYSDPNWYPDNTLNRTRLGGVLGIGHSFRPYGGLRYSLEAALHKTLSGTDTAAGDPPASDFVRIGFGFIF
jgi:hypothetical protein